MIFHVNSFAPAQPYHVIVGNYVTDNTMFNTDIQDELSGMKSDMFRRHVSAAYHVGRILSELQLQK